MRIAQLFLSFDRTVQTLVLNQFAINLGFFMLIPFLPGYLTNELGFAGWMVGLVVGARNLSQQGLFVLGGTLSDRIGYRPVIIAGCMTRTLGFTLLGLMTSLPGVVLAAILTGLAGSLFAPAVRAYLAVASGERRVDAFALYNIAFQTGLLAGPLVGVALLGLDFRLVCWLSAGIFGALSLLQLFFLPAREGSQAHASTSVLSDWREALGNRAFVLFSLGMLAYFTLYNQLYLSLPLEVQRLTGQESGVGLVFTLSGLLTIFFQSQVTEYCKQHWRPMTAIVIGMGLMGLAFAPLFLAAPLFPMAGVVLPAGLGGDSEVGVWLGQTLTAALNLAPILLATALLTLGVMVCLPFTMDMIPALGGGRLVGTYFGLYYLATGAGSAVGNLVVGSAFDVGQAIGVLGLPWLLLLLLGAGSAGSVAVLDRRGWLAARPTLRPAAE